MKKFIALFLSVLMMLSSFAVIGFAEGEAVVPEETTAAEEKTNVDKLVDAIGFEEALKNFNSDGTEIPSEYLDGENQYDIEKLLADGVLDNVNMLGLSVDFLYNSTDTLIWPTLSVTKSDLALAKANLNMYLLGVLKKKIGSVGSVKLFTAENATAISNFIGKRINPDFTPVTLTGDKYSSEEGFYEGIASASGLADVIQHNWCDQTKVNFKPLLYVLGFDFGDDNMLGESKLKSGDRIAKTLVKSVITRVLEKGPIEYVLTVISNMAKTYSMFMLEPLKALFKGHIVRGTITEEELGTMKGLFNLISNLNNPDDTQHIQFISVPTYRFALATSVKGSASSTSTDTTEMFLYMMLYLNLVGKNKSNGNAVEIMKENVLSSDLEDKDKSNINIIINGLFLGDLSEMVGILDDLVIDNLDQTKTTIMENIYNFFASFFKNIANIIKKIIYSFTHFGEF
ncbi:MAG: hypothetical protein ACI4GY_01945 [Acutalibacteraceae bacterium]